MLKMHFGISERGRKAKQAQMCCRKKSEFLFVLLFLPEDQWTWKKIDRFWTWVKNVILPVLLTTPASLSVQLSAPAKYLKIEKTEHLNAMEASKMTSIESRRKSSHEQ